MGDTSFIWHSTKYAMADESGGDDEKDLEELLQGDEFITEEDRQEMQARERRLARKRRLQELEQNTNQEAPPAARDKQKLKQIQIQNDTSAEAPPHQMKTEPKQSNIIKKEEKDDTAISNDDDDDFDMFSSSVSPNLEARPAAGAVAKAGTAGTTAGNVDQQADWDDAEGYYKATIGEIMTIDLADSSLDLQFKVMGVIGKGVFSTVLKCSTESSNQSTPLPPQVAIKTIRHNETMAKAAHKEIKILQRFTSCPGIIPLLLPANQIPLEYRGHILLVFPYMEYNLRDVLQKFGKGVGLSLTAVRSYFGQLLAALTHLKNHNVIHSDLKPDNILVSADFATVQLCDFGSAVDTHEAAEMVTPYLVSRFYRAPEIILGLIPTVAIDLWSIAVTVAELFLGRVLFQGKTNNDMILQMMQHMGPISNRLIRQHNVQTKRFPIASHFSQQATNYVFRQETTDPVTKKAVSKTVSLQGFTPTLQSKLLKAKSSKDSRTLVLQFSDLLQKCLVLDPTRRVAVKMALQHQFFKEKEKTQL